METTTKERLINAYNQITPNHQFARNIESLKAEFPAFMNLLKNNPNKPIGQSVFAFCKKHYVTCKKGFGFIFVKSLMEAHDETEILNKWNDEQLSEYKQRSLEALGLDLDEVGSDDYHSEKDRLAVAKTRSFPPREDVDQRSTAMMPYGDHLPDSED